MNVLGLIMARGGSKGVPGKNIRQLAGKPLLAYTIESAHAATGIERTILSTDSPEIAEVGRAWGVEVPFIRPGELARDTTTDLEVIRHALGFLEGAEYIVHLRPTTPLRDPALINGAIERILSHREATSLRSVHELAEPPHKMFQIRNDCLEGFFPDDPRPEYFNLPRQLLPKAYHPNGYVDIVRRSFVATGRGLHGPRILAFVTPFAVEVDRLKDFEYLEFLLARRRTEWPILHSPTTQ